MEAFFTALEEAFRSYRQDLEAFERKRKPTDGLLGFGRSLQDDPCHDRLDERVREAVEGICASHPTPAEARRAVAMLLPGAETEKWPLAAQWMLRAVERHSLPLIPYLAPEDANAFLQAYARRYKPWDRLPAQKQVYQALKGKILSNADS